MDEEGRPFPPSYPTGYPALMAEPHSPLRLILDGEALVENWRWLRKQSAGAGCGAAVKADGYGLGARDVVMRLANEAAATS